MMRSRRWYLIFGGLMVGVILFVAIFADYTTKVSPYYMDAKPNILQGTPPFPPGPDHLLGTDQYGRDIWSRIAYGTRWSLLFAFLVMAARLLIAVPMATLSAFGPRPFAWLLGRLYVYTSAIPPLLIYMLVLLRIDTAIGLWPNVIITITLLTLVEWPRLAVVLKGRLEELSTEQFVEGAVSIGATPWRIFWVHLMPHLWSTMLHLIVGEMGRALLIIAQLGVFGVWVGGGILELFEDARGREFLDLIAGVPEWGTMIGNSRIFIFSAPWIPIAPAFAFFFGVVGFNLLSQGLEGTIVSLASWKERTTGRFSPRWRMALIPLAVGAIGWYYGGVPWGREAEIAALAAKQSELITNRSVEGYLATMTFPDASVANEQKRWAEAFLTSDYGLVAVSPKEVQLNGNKATAIWELSVGYQNKPPVIITRKVDLTRQWGTWYEAGDSMTALRGYSVDFVADYDPNDPGPKAITTRWTVHFLATAADHAFQRALALFPPSDSKERLTVKLYTSHESFLAAIVGEPAASNPESTMWYTPGQTLRVSPAVMTKINRRTTERLLTHEMIKFLIQTRLGSPKVLPIFMGASELGTDTKPGDLYRFDYEAMIGTPMFSLTDLFSVGTTDLPQKKQQVFVAQTALFLEFMEKKHTRDQIFTTITGVDDVLGSLAKLMGISRDQLAADYDAYVQARFAGRSVLNLPAGRARIPLALTDAVEQRGKAALKGDETAFLGMVNEAGKETQSKWLAAAKNVGLKGYEATVLEADIEKQKTRVYLLERFTTENGKISTGVTVQDWFQVGGKWLIGPALNPLLLGGT